ncbi:MAG: ABC transporter permease [Dermatophilaceae bacterium]
MSWSIPRQGRVFASLVARDVTVALTYRGWLALLQISNLVVPVISLLAWQGALAVGATLPVTAEYLVTYFVMVSIVSMLTSSWTTNFLAESIRLGHLSSWLVRPCSTHLNSVANNVAEKLVKLLLLIPMVGVLALLVRGQLGLPTDPRRWLGFALGIVLAAGITYSLDIIIASLAFWLEDVTGIDRFRGLLARVLSGGIVPLALFPSWMAGPLNIQPFRFMLSFPLEVLLGTDGGPVVVGFALQAGWCALFAGLAALVWRRGLRGYQAAGA